MKEFCTLSVKLHIISSRMQRVNQQARPSIIQVGCPTCCYQVCALDHANGGTADLDYSSGPCHRNGVSMAGRALLAGYPQYIHYAGRPRRPHLWNSRFRWSRDLAHASIPLAQTPWGLTRRTWLQAGAQWVVIVVPPPHPPSPHPTTPPPPHPTTPPPTPPPPPPPPPHPTPHPELRIDKTSVET